MKARCWMLGQRLLGQCPFDDDLIDSQPVALSNAKLAATMQLIAQYTDELAAGSFQATLERRQRLYQAMATLGFPWSYTWLDTYWKNPSVRKTLYGVSCQHCSTNATKDLDALYAAFANVLSPNLNAGAGGKSKHAAVVVTSFAGQWQEYSDYLWPLVRLAEVSFR